MKYVISYSGGLGSFAAAKLTVEAYGAKNCVLAFTDTKTEDEDLYRFINETKEKLGTELVTLADGRNIWEVFTNVRFMGNSRIDPCSRVLKRDLFRKWIEKTHKAEQTTIVFGIDSKESHRMKTIEARWNPWKTAAPLCDQLVTREKILDWLDEYGIEPPRLYEMGFPHNNCGGFCVKTGQKQMALLLKKLPERYAEHEAQQEKLFAIIGKRRGFIRRTENGVMNYMGMKEFREFLQSGGAPDMYNEDGCGCFV
jgi:3'-phosphoadenosine 5'-phosphosulfate sulfotransferase (PAPS reductase)/FAD synthetase